MIRVRARHEPGRELIAELAEATRSGWLEVFAFPRPRGFGRRHEVAVETERIGRLVGRCRARRAS